MSVVNNAAFPLVFHDTVLHWEHIGVATSSLNKWHSLSSQLNTVSRSQLACHGLIIICQMVWRWCR